MKNIGAGMSRFKSENIFCSKAIRFLWFALVAGVVVFFFKQNLVTYSQISLSLQTERPVLVQVFCDVGVGFNEAQSSSVKTSAAQQKGEQFRLTIPASCNRLRLDLGDKGSIIKLSSASIVTSNGDQIDVLDRILSPALLNEVKISEADRTQFVATADDPWVLLNGEFTILTVTGFSWMGMLEMLFLYVIVLAVVVILDYWVNKKEKTGMNESGDPHP